MKKRFIRFISFLVTLVIFSNFIPTVFAYNTGDDYPYKNSCAGCHEIYRGDSHNDISEWHYYYRQCTDFCAWCLNSRNGIAFNNRFGNKSWGDASTWDEAARALGYTVDSNPAVGAIAQINSGEYGHVAWVSAVNGDYVTIEEYNYAYTGNFNTRTVHKSNFQYIHIKDIGTSPQPHIYDDKNVAHPKEDVKFSYSGLTEASKVEICFQKNGKVYYSDDATKSRDYYTYFNYEGQYYVFVRGLYDNVWYESNKILVEITNPQFNVSKTDVEPYEQIVFSYENLTNANKVELCFEKDNSIYYTIDVTKDKKCTNFFENTGIYNTFVRAYYNGTPIESNKISIIVSQSYFINYDANGGSNAPATQKKSSSSALSLSSIEPTRNGYTFKNWNTKADGSGTSYQSGETYTTNADATLYAQWEKIISTQTKVTKKPTYSLINIAVENAEIGTNVIVAMYNQNRMVDFQTEIYDGNDISLATFSKYDEIKVMIWKDLSTLKPLGNVEIIKN